MTEVKTWILSSDAFGITSLSNISRNLTECYKLHDSSAIEISLNSSHHYLEILLGKLPEVVVVVHPSVVAHPFLKHLLSREESKTIKFIIHAVGDFLRRSVSYLSLEPLLLGKDIHWVMPSSGYAAVTQSMFQNISDQSVINIPIDKKSFHYDLKLRDLTRSELGLDTDEICFLYTGRISEQKNVDIAIKLVEECSANLGLKYRFLIAGPVDDYEGASVGFPKELGVGFFALKSFLDKNDKIQWLSHQNGEELKKLYNAADIFVSLSCYHDESFGMSPLEALACGTPCVLSNWGGFRDFHQASPEYSLMINVDFDKDGFKFSKEDFTDCLKKAIALKDHREICSKIYLESFSHLTILKNIKECVLSKKNSFAGFSDKYRKLTFNNIKEGLMFSKKFEDSHHFGIKIRSWNRDEYESVYKFMWKRESP